MERCRSLKEYLNYLNFSSGSCGEFHSCYESFHQAEQISDDEYEEADRLHYKVENELIKLIESLQNKNSEEDEGSTPKEKMAFSQIAVLL